MVYLNLSFHKQDGVMVVKAITDENEKLSVTRLSDELSELCPEINRDEETRVVILTGTEEKSFFFLKYSSGALNLINEESRVKFLSMAESIAQIDKPVIAAINGDALGQGLELVLACDIRIATENARFGLPQIQAGLLPYDGGTQRLPRLIGKSKAMEMILTGGIIDVREAYRVGLVNRIVPEGSLMKESMDLALAMASKGPVALRYAKEAVTKGLDLTLKQGLALEGDLYFLLHTTKDRTEGITAFREKKSPRFEGR